MIAALFLIALAAVEAEAAYRRERAGRPCSSIVTDGIAGKLIGAVALFVLQRGVS